ncbi:protein FREE1 [Silene latifolia]|uniref:protein FREE1 n=1 Tax=Silene latifolia TaxID=37657 RepID=UPI003D7838DE
MGVKSVKMMVVQQRQQGREFQFDEKWSELTIKSYTILIHSVFLSLSLSWYSYSISCGEMHQPGGEYPSTPYYYPPPPPTTTSSASAPPFTDYSSSASSYSYNYPSYPPPPPPLSDPPPPPTHHQPDTHLHYNNNNPPPSYFPPNYDHSPPNYSHSSPNYPTPYDPNPPSLNYPPTPYDYNNTNPNPNTPSYAPKYDHSGSAYLDPNLTAYGTAPSTRPTSASPAVSGYDYNYNDDGVYAYQGKHEPYGARGTGTSSKSSSNSQTWSGLFDDYGRPISFPDKHDKTHTSTPSLKVVRAVPKVDDKPDVQGGVQKFKVKLLPESGSQSTMDVICMVGLDGIRMLDPNTSRTLRIYPLDTVTRCDKIDSSTFAFWSKTPVDIDPRRIRLQSNTYTTNTILDTVTAATVQFKEMGGRIRPSEASKSLEVPSEKKKGLGDWITKLKPVNEEKDHWVPDEAVSKCTGCGSDFGAFNRRHHCRNCGDVFCDKCTQGRTPLTSEENAQPVRVCDRCMAEVTHRLSKAKEAASRPVTFQSHEDLAKKLQEEMEKNLRISSGSKSKSESSGKRMREVACPTCTVHLQVQVPSSGSETIECGVCQQPFIVSAH